MYCTYIRDDYQVQTEIDHTLCKIERTVTRFGYENQVNTVNYNHTDYTLMVQ